MDSAGRGSVAGPSLKRRFAAAIALTIAFYTLALLIAAGLLAAAILPWVFDGRNNLWVTVTGVLLAGSILWAILPRRLPFRAPGVRLTSETQPRLLAVIDEEAEACGERAPEEVYATFEVNAAVLEVNRRRRVMIVGLPLLHLVSERGLRAVIAHEFGHYTGGDTKLGPWIFRTRTAIGRTIGQLSSEDGDEGWTQRAVRAPFIWYGKAFLRITNAISRREEFAADARAAHRGGREVYSETLRRLEAYAPAFDAYWANEVAPLLSSGRRPPIGAGFSAFIRAETIDKAANEHLQRELAEGKTDPYDSHPSLAERIAALQDVPPGDPDDSPQADTLVDDPLALERAQAVHLFGAEAGALPPVEWDAVGAEVYLERARRLVEAHGELLGAATAGELDAVVDQLGRVAGELQAREPELEVEHARDFAAALISDGLLVALHEHGWSVEAPPAEPVLCCRGDDRVPPHAVVHDLREGRLDAGAWRERAQQLGIAGLRLSVAVAR
ncbi:MAG TPA: M48 family metallopeptidase [Solirubrobacteraceae bacterium]|nr:M48 family metallopeptidase [Solirubrobacteraceae bacterium]